MLISLITLAELADAGDEQAIECLTDMWEHREPKRIHIFLKGGVFTLVLPRCCRPGCMRCGGRQYYKQKA